MNEFWLCFVPLFVAVDAIGVLPIFMALTDDLEPPRIRAVILQSIVTAASVTIVFLLFGPALLAFLGVSVPDFMMAGGLLLLVISLSHLLTGEKKHRSVDAESLGAVPVGVPLITGPAVLTTCILLTHTHSTMITATAAVANIVLAGLILGTAKPVTRILGRTGIKAVSKVTSLFLAAIAVMLIRRGLFEALAAAGR